VRRFWKGTRHASECATRLSGSSDLYQQSGRAPYASINFITCHDGFTLQDLVSYHDKHNEANGEGNRDGANDNNSWNCGAEGPSDDPKIRALRERQKRNLVATLFLSAGVPMLCAGDELGHTQHGNNNAYCQDNDTTWFNWELSPQQQGFLEFVRKVSQIWRSSRSFSDGSSSRPPHSRMDIKTWRGSSPMATKCRTTPGTRLRPLPRRPVGRRFDRRGR